MSEKISVNQALDKAKSHVKNGEIIEAQNFTKQFLIPIPNKQKISKKKQLI